MTHGEQILLAFVLGSAVTIALFVLAVKVGEWVDPEGPNGPDAEGRCPTCRRSWRRPEQTVYGSAGASRTWT